MYMRFIPKWAWREQKKKKQFGFYMNINKSFISKTAKKKKKRETVSFTYLYLLHFLDHHFLPPPHYLNLRFHHPNLHHYHLIHRLHLLIHHSLIHFLSLVLKKINVILSIYCLRRLNKLPVRFTWNFIKDIICKAVNYLFITCISLGKIP